VAGFASEYPAGLNRNPQHGYVARGANGLFGRGFARARSGELDAGINDVRDGVALWRGQGGLFHSTEMTTGLCNLLVLRGGFNEASRLLDEAEALVVGTDEACALAECIRVRGLIAAGQGDLPSAQSLCEEAISVSRKQEARLFELRATANLAHVLARQGQGDEGERRLRAILDTFETKRPIVDIVAARKVLNTLLR
jgi:hypothetical protein